MKRNIDYNMTIVKIYKYMIEYQKKKNIKSQCGTNVSYLYDYITQGGTLLSPNQPKVKAVICVARIPGPSTNSPDRLYICNNHLVLMHQDGFIIDPSYEINQIPNIEYYLTIKEANDVIKYAITPEGKPTRLSKKQVNGFLQATKDAKRINNGECLVSQRKYYNEQADYVETRMREDPRIINIKIL